LIHFSIYVIKYKKGGIDLAHIKNLWLIQYFFLTVLLLLVTSALSFAEEFNVSNAIELRDALITSQSNGEIDFINIAPGVYDTGGVPFIYTAAFTENFGLNITGSGSVNTTLGASGQSAVLIMDTQGVFDDFNVNVNIEDLTIQGGDSAPFSNVAGGLTILSDNGNIMVHGCNFEDNMGDTGGGARIETLGQVSISNSVFDNNTSLSSDGGGALLTGNFILLTDNVFNLNSTDSIISRGGGLRAIALATNGGSPANGSIIFNGNAFTNNESTGHGGASLTAEFGVELQGNNFIDNTAGDAGAGGVFINVLNTDPGPPPAFSPVLPNTLLTTLFSNLFQGNTSIGGSAGGAQVISGLDIILVNNIFLENFGASAGGALLQAPDITVTNNTFTLNEAIGVSDGDGGGLMIFVEDETTADIYNNIVFDNVASGVGADIFVDDDPNIDQIGATVNLISNDFSDFFSVCESIPICFPNINAMDNIDRDPRFVDAQAGNVNLSRGSPAISAGDSGAPELPSSDFAGNSVGDSPDMGALQFVGGGGGGNSTCSLASDSQRQSGVINTLALLLVPGVLLILISIRRRVRNS